MRKPPTLGIVVLSEQEDAYFRDYRLQQLLAEFEEAERQYNEWRDSLNGLPQDEYLKSCDDHEDRVWDQLELTERRYIIARDFNEFDPQRADMLWKLQKQ